LGHFICCVGFCFCWWIVEFAGVVVNVVYVWLSFRFFIGEVFWVFC